MICHDCIWSTTFTKRADEPSSFGCKRPHAGGVYVLNPDAPTCLPRDWTPKAEAGRAALEPGS
jgi:hypothetical protein